jgi:predicted nuclease of predicted toxin-antitoxin system
MRFAADENFNGKVLDKLVERLPGLDMVRVQDTALYGATDAAILQWAAIENRVLITHDVQTLVNDAYERVRTGLPMPGVIRVSNTADMGLVIDDLEVLLGAGQPGDFDSQVKHVPVR